MKSALKARRGQVIILFVLALVGLLAFAGLAIDAAMIYSNRRLAQSAADSAAMAGAGAAGSTMQLRDIYYISDTESDFDCGTFNTPNQKMDAVRRDAIDAAIQRAGVNAFSLDNDLSDGHGVEVTCHPSPFWYDRYIQVEVQITAETGTSFSHLVFNRPLVNTVTGIARVYPPTSMTYGNAIVAMDETNCGTGSDKGGIEFGGNLQIDIDGGGIFSHSCIDASGAISVTASGSGISYMTTIYPPTGHGSILAPTPYYKEDQGLPIDPIDPPDCDGVAADGTPYYSGNWVNNGGQIKGNSDITITPGNYSLIDVKSSQTLTMEPGLYCLTGDFSVSGSAVVNAQGVTLYIQKKGPNQSSDFSITGEPTVNMTSPLSDSNSLPALEGILVIYAEDNSDGVITLEGTGNSLFGGTFYAPNNLIKIGGTSSTGISNTEYSCEFIGDRITTSGTADINITSERKYTRMRPPWLELTE